MSKQLKLRRGTTAQHSTFTGAEGEVTVDTTKDTLVVHDGTTAGGIPLATEASLTTGLNGKLGTGAGAVGTTNLASNAVTTVKITDDAVTTAKIAAGAVGTTELASNAVTTVKITDANITASKLSGAQSGSAPIYGARAWVNFNGTGTVAIRASGNVSSITDKGTGNYTVNFTTAMPDANFVLAGIASDSVSGGARAFVAQPFSSPNTTTSTSFFTTRPEVSLVDPTFVNAAIFR